MTERQHSVLAMILVIMGLYIMRISALEVQPVGEADIAMRAEAILSSGAWMDPSEHTVGGLSSVASAPLPAWMSAVGIAILGPTEIGVRLLSILSVLLTLGLTYLIATRVLAHRYAMLATATVGLSMPMITLGRQMSPEIIATSMLMLGWWSVLRVRDAAAVRSRLVFAVTSGIALAGVLLSAMFLAVVVLGLLIPLLVRRTTLIYGTLALAIGLLLALPWYAIMFSHHGSDFILAQSIATTSAALREGGSSGGPLDILLMLVMASPLLIASLLWVVAAVCYRELLPQRDDIVLASAGLWFVGLMLVGAIGRQPEMSAVIAIIPVAAIISQVALQSAMHRPAPGLLLLFLGCIILATIGTLLFYVRASLGAIAPVSIVVSVLVLLLLVALTRGAARRRALAARTTRPVIYSALSATALAAVMTILIGNPSTISGGRKVALRLLEDTAYARTFVYLHHGVVSGASVNSQLAWYTRGWMAHRDARYDFTPLAMPATIIDEDVVRAGIGAPWIVYCHLGASKEEIARVEELLDANYVLDEDTKHYLLFERRLRVTSDR